MKIKDLIPKKTKVKMTLFQVALPNEVYRKLIDKLKKDKVKRRAFMLACAQQYLKEK